MQSWIFDQCTLGVLAIKVYIPEFQTLVNVHCSGKVSQITVKISQNSGKISQISVKISQIFR